MKKKRSLLDRVNRISRGFSGRSDRATALRITEYLDAVREVERRIQKAEEQNSDSTLPVPERPVGIPRRFDDHLKLLYDLQWLAYQGDLTRVFTLMYGRELNSRSYPGDRHLRAASRPVASRRQAGADREVLAAEHVSGRSCSRYFLEKLRSTPDGDGNLLDHTILLYGGGMSNPNVHLHVNLPLVVAGGGAGR